MKALMDAARDHGLAVIEGSVLAHNTAMLQLMKELGFSVSRSADDKDVVLISRRL